MHAIRVVREVARQGGFAGAARALNSSPPSVSRIVADLEADLGLRLFTRSTRHVALTEDGEDYLRRAATLADELDILTEETRERGGAPRGHLRVTSVVAFGQERIAPLLAEFTALYPDITAELQISNRKVDLIQEHFDLAIRIGGSDGLSESSLKARRIFSQKLIFVASPEFVERHGEPSSLDDLSRSPVIKQVSGNWGKTTAVTVDGNKISVDLSERFVVNSPNAARNAVRAGAGLALLADYLVEDDIGRGRLVRLLPEVESEEQPIFAVFVHRNYMPAKVRALIDHLVDGLSR